MLRVQGVDMFDNVVEVDADNTTVSCTSGSAKHVTGDTWELDISSAGNDRSCNILWSGLISQNYFDVDAVLLGGAVGSTNTAMGLGIFLLTLILVTLVVLVRRANQEEDEDWVEDAFEDDDEYDEEDDDDEDSEEISSSESSSLDSLVKSHQMDKENTQQDSEGVLTDELRATLAQQAAEIGVMQAAPGTEQGSSGWYVDVSSEVQYWNVGADGSWTRGD